MSHVESGPLATYSSLQDKHLVGYFNNSRMRRHLRRSGLVTRNGEIITENSFRLNMARKEHQKHVRDLMAQAIVHKALDMERHRQSQIKRKLEEISKVELVQRVRSTRGRKGDEDITPYLSPRAPGARPKSAKQERPRSVVSGHRPATAPSKHAGASKKKSSVYVDHEGFPVHRDQAWAETASDSDEEIDSQNLRELDPYIMNNITLNMSPEERRSNSPYKVDLTLPPEPRPPTRAPPGSRKTPRVSSSRSVITKDGRRIRPKSNKGSLSLHRKEPAYPHAAQQQTLCDVTIKYRGSNLKLQYERQDKRDEIVINQQHCGGGNLVVFHGLVEPGTDLVFTSRRHRGYPFSLTFFLNQIQVLRLSACCEYKYGPGVLLGGRKGHFKFGRVDGGSPCYKCMVEAELARRERQRYKDTQTEEPKPEPEPEPILESQGTQSDPPPPETRDQNEQAEADEEAKDAEGGYDDEDFEEEDGAQADSEKEDASKTEDKNSDHFFSGPESDTEQKQPDDVDYDADSDFEVESNHGKQKEEEKDEEIKEEVKEEGDEEDAKKEASEDEPIHSEIEADEDSKEDEGTPQEVLMEENIPEEKEEPKVREEEQGTEAGRQSSAFDSDSDSDGEDHNKVLSSSSSSSSEDEADQKAPATIVTSSSDSDADEEHNFVREEVEDTDKDVQASAEEAISEKDDDEDTNTKKVKQEEDNIKEEEIPPKDEEKDVQREEEEDKNADKIQSSAEETIPAKDGEEVESKDEEKKPDLRAHLKDVVNFDDSADDDVQADQKRDVEVKEEQPLSSTVNPEDTKTDKEADDDIKEENNATKEKQNGDDKEESEKEEKTFGDKIKSMFGSSDSDSSSDSSSSSSSDSDSERKKKKKHRKKKGEAKKKDTQVHVETKSGSDSENERRSTKEKSDSEKEEIKAECKEEDAITQDDSSKEDASTLAEVDHSEDEKEKTEDAISADEQPETGATMQKEEKEDRDEDSQSQSEKLVIDDENDNDKDKGDTVSLGKDSLSENRNDAQTKDDTEMQDSDTEKEDHQKSEEPDQDEASQSQSERLVSDEEKDDTASLQNDAASENVDDGGVQTKDDEEKSESDVGRLAPHVLIEEATSDEEQKEDDQDADNSTSVDEEKEVVDSDKGDVDSNKIDEDDEKQTTEDVHSNKEEDNDAGSNEKEADEEQHTTEDEDATGKEEDSKEEVQEKEDKEQNEEFEAKQDEIKDEDKTDERPKEEVNPEGSQSSRSSASESGSIATGLDKNYRILNLNAKNMDERKAGKLAKALKKHKYRNLEYLLLRENSLTDTGLATVIRSLIERHNESTSADSTLKLTHLDLGNSGMGEESAAELARLLTLDTPLRNLNISENELSTAAWASIIDHIKRNKSLVTFSAEYAHLSDTSCVMLMEALSDHEKLEELNIEGNGLGERAGKAVAQLVKDNSIIISVNFERDNSISPQILAEVKEILETGSYVP